MRVGLSLFLTGRCNLACSYCYQGSGPRAGRLDWEVVGTALEAALALNPDILDVVFNGGEPLLEPEMLRRCLEHLSNSVPPEVELRPKINSNGTLLSGQLTRLLEAHSVDLQLGWHDDQPSSHNSSRVNAIVRRLFSEHPDYASQRVSVAMVITSDRVPHLAQRVEDLISLGITEIRLAPPFTADPAWTPSAGDQLRHQFERIAETSLAHWQATRSIPVAVLRPSLRARNTSSREADRCICQAGSGNIFCVDPKGTAWACPRFDPNLQRLPPLAARVSPTLDLGDIRSSGFGDHLAGLPSSVRDLRPFTGRRSKRSNWANCLDCRWLEHCEVCPAAICHCGSDPDLVPDHHCAFQRAALEAKQRFADRTGGADLRSGFGRLRYVLDRLERALRRDFDATTREDS